MRLIFNNLKYHVVFKNLFQTERFLNTLHTDFNLKLSRDYSRILLQKPNSPLFLARQTNNIRFIKTKGSLWHLAAVFGNTTHYTLFTILSLLCKDFIAFLICFEKSKRELSRALLACPFAEAAGFLGILWVYPQPLGLVDIGQKVYLRVYRYLKNE